MTNSRFKKACIVGMCITAISSGTVFANPALPLEREISIEIGLENPLVQKQKEIGTFVFKTNAQEIGDFGFKEKYEIILEDRPMASSVPRIFLNNQWLKTDVAPFIENSRTLVPLRGLMEKLGAMVDWDPKEQIVNVDVNDICIELVIGQDTAKITKIVDGIKITERAQLDVPARIVEGRTFVPARFVAEALGARVDWDGVNQVVTIDTGEDNPIITIERPISYEMVDVNNIGDEELTKWYNDNHQTAGFYEYTENNWKYVLIAAGEQRTGGYSLQVNSITQVSIDTVYIDATLIAPPKDAFVTEALTYPYLLIRFESNRETKVIGDLNHHTPNEIMIGEIGPSLEEMGKAIDMDMIEEMKMYSLMLEDLKTFTPAEIKDLVSKLNTSPTYDGPILMMLAGNRITIKLSEKNLIQLTSYGNEEHVVVTGEIDDEYVGYCIVNNEIGKLLLGK